MIDTPPPESEENFVDEPASEKKSGSPTLVLWLVVLSISALFVSLTFIPPAIDETMFPLQTQNAEIQATLASPIEPNPTVEYLQENLSRIQEQADAIAPISEQLANGHVNWPLLMRVLTGYDMATMAITGLSQTEHYINLNGKAHNESIVTTYAENLRASGQFDEVVIHTIKLKTLPTPTPLPETTPQPIEPVTRVEFTLLLDPKAGEADE